jgi:predicted Fe-Mo cluster-binding NifX family protein
MAGRDVRAVLAGNCGSNAYQTLNAAGIEVIVGVSGKARERGEAWRSRSSKR